jgi:hypothetical protein
MQTKLAMADIAFMGNYAAALTYSHNALELGNLNYGNSENA